jgi:hypothetical protein
MKLKNKTKKTFLSIILMLFWSQLFSQTAKEICNDFSNAIEKYIQYEDSIDVIYRSDSYKHKVFAAKIYYLDSSNTDFGFTISYIMNQSMFEIVKPEYYINFQGRIILINFANNFPYKVFNELNLNLIPKDKEFENSITKREIFKFLFPPTISASYEPTVSLFFRINGMKESYILKSNTMIPREISIYNNFSFMEGVNIDNIRKKKQQKELKLRTN